MNASLYRSLPKNEFQIRNVNLRPGIVTGWTKRLSAEIPPPLPPFHHLRFFQNTREGRFRGVAPLHPCGGLLLDHPLSVDPVRAVPRPLVGLTGRLGLRRKPSSSNLGPRSLADLAGPLGLRRKPGEVRTGRGLTGVMLPYILLIRQTAAPMSLLQTSKNHR